MDKFERQIHRLFKKSMVAVKLAPKNYKKWIIHISSQIASMELELANLRIAGGAIVDEEQ